MIVPDEQIATREVKDWKGLHLLHFHSSSCSQKVRTLGREKGLEWVSHPVDLMAEEHVSPWYMGINPRGVVPVLVHDGVVHIESNDILEYLDALPSEVPAFFPADAAARDAVREELAHEDSLHMALRSLTMGFLVPQRLARKSEQTLQRWAQEGRDDPKRAHEVEWWRDYARDGISDEAAREATAAHRAVFERLDARLADSTWLLGENLSVLDVTWFITTLRLSKLGYPLEIHPNLAAWHARLEQRPAFAEETSEPLQMRIALPVYQTYRRLAGTRLVDVVDFGA